MVVVTQVNTLVKTHIIVHLKFTITSQPCRVGTCTVFNPEQCISRRLDGCSPWDFIFASFVSHHHGQKMLKVWKGVSLRWI